MIPSDNQLMIKAVKKMVSDNYRFITSKIELMIENEESLFRIQEFLNEEMKEQTELCSKLIELEDKENG